MSKDKVVVPFTDAEIAENNSAIEGLSIEDAKVELRVELGLSKEKAAEFLKLNPPAKKATFNTLFYKALKDAKMDAETFADWIERSEEITGKSNVKNHKAHYKGIWEVAQAIWVQVEAE